MPSHSKAAPTALSALQCATACRPRPSLPRPSAAVVFCNHFNKASKLRLVRELDRSARAAESRSAPSASMTQLDKMAHAAYFKDGGGPLFPGTFISLPLSLVPRNPAAFALYQWSRLKHWGLEAASVLGFKLKSMPNWTSRPRWKARRGRIALTARAMYQEMLEAFAAGDTATVEKLCVGEFGARLVAAIDRRDPRERVRFEIVKHNSPLLYPRLMAHQMHQVNPYDKVSVLEQAVVAVASTQRVSRHVAATGETVPGSVKVQDKIEYVVLSRQVNGKTFESAPWRIWGTTAATTLEKYLKEREAIAKEDAQRAGWKSEAK